MKPSKPPMDNSRLIDASKDQLNRILGFFSRVDSKASVILSVNTAMLGLLAATIPPLKSLEWYMAFVLIPIGLIGASFYHLYLQATPQLEGGERSLLYLREIANRTEAKYVEEFLYQK